MSTRTETSVPNSAIVGGKRHWTGQRITALLLLCACLVSNSTGQQLSETQVKGSYIFNFIKYVEWENENASPELMIGIFGDNEALFTELSNAIAGTALRNKTIRVNRIENLTRARDAQVLVISRSENARLEDIALAPTSCRWTGYSHRHSR